VLKAPFMVAEMLKRAERVKARAEAHRPFDPDDPDLVHYRDHFYAEAGLRTDRAYGRVTNTDMPTALFVEFGTKNNPRHRTLGNALDAAG
jgi:hypothetical protein